MKISPYVTLPSPSEPLAAAGPERARPTGGEKSETIALALSLGGTLASYGLFWYAIENEDVADDDESYQAIAMTASLGTFFAPSFGHWYTGKFATRGLGLRAAGAGTALIAMTWAFSECPLFGGECEESAGPKVLGTNSTTLPR